MALLCEDLIIRLVPVKDIPELVRTGVIKHAIVVVALHYHDLHRLTQGR